MPVHSLRLPNSFWDQNPYYKVSEGFPGVNTIIAYGAGPFIERSCALAPIIPDATSEVHC